MVFSVRELRSIVETGLAKKIPPHVLHTLVVLGAHTDATGFSTASESELARYCGVHENYMYRRLRTCLAFRYKGRPVLWRVACSRLYESEDHCVLVPSFALYADENGYHDKPKDQFRRLMPLGWVLAGGSAEKKLEEAGKLPHARRIPHNGNSPDPVLVWPPKGNEASS